MKIISILLVVCVAWQAAAVAQDDGEPRVAPVRGLLKRGLLSKGKPTTTTTTPAPQEEVEYEDDAEYPAEDGQVEPSSEAPTSTTEGKKLIKGGVRPFRSNSDLLETLKRRRAQVAEAKLHGTATASLKEEPSTEAPVKATFNKKRYSAAKEANIEESPAPSVASSVIKPSRNRFGRPSSRSLQDSEAEEQLNDATAPVRTGRTFSRRGN